MTWIIKNWYFILIGGAIIIWIVIDPSYNQQEQTLVQMNQEETKREEIKEESETQIDYMVDIKGAVTNPGVYLVMEDNRVQDVINMAGGFEHEANKEAINLAERVYDEMVIIVPYKGEENVIQLAESDNDKIKINLATVEEIIMIPGIGEVKANAIIEYRETNGKFKQIEDLTKVSGIGEKTLELMQEHVQIP